MVLSYRTGAAGMAAAAGRMAGYYASELDVPALSKHLASYLGEHFGPEIEGRTSAVPARDMHPLIASALGIDPTRSLTEAEMARLLSGQRADGLDIPGKQQQKSAKGKSMIAYTDFCFSAPKSFSVALALSKSESEKAALETAWMRANNALNRHIASQIGKAEQGHAGSKGSVLGHLAVVSYHHYTSRPTIKLPVTEGGVIDTELMTIPENVPGDMNRHTHNIFIHAAATEDGRVLTPNLDETRERIHEWGAIGHAYLATYLREAGVNVEIDAKVGLSRLSDVPRCATDLFQSRADLGEELARRYAADHGHDWDGMDADRKRVFITKNVAASRQAKGDGAADYAAWHKRAADAGYNHRSVLRPDEKWSLPARDQRIATAHAAGLPFLDAEFVKRSTLDGSTMRTWAARSLIASGIESPADVDAVTAMYRTDGITQDKRHTKVQWLAEEGKRWATVTTELHVDHEMEAIGLLRTAAADKSASLTREQIDAAIVRVNEKRVAAGDRPYDFTTGHGAHQRVMIDSLATAGRAVVGIGVAGSGKTALITPVLEAYHAEGWQSYGITLAWRQTHGLKEAGVRKRDKKVLHMEPDTSKLVEAGVSEENALALTPFIKAAQKGKLALDAKSIVVVDEVATISTRQILDLARLQAKYGFKIAGLGDPEQCQSIEAGNTVNLFRHALGKDQVPELLETVRQKRLEDRETARLFREGKAAPALDRKLAAGLLSIVPGGYTDTIKATVDEWERRKEANTGRADYTLGISVPTNSDVLAVGLEIRRRQIARGEIAGSDWRVPAVDQSGVQTDLAVATGDRVRLFKRVNASYGNGEHGRFGENGTTALVTGMDKDGLMLQRENGRVGKVKWDSLRCPDTGRIMIAYGHALTIDARQGATLTDHITALPAGTQQINAFKMYPADTRNTHDSVLIVSHGAEKEEVKARRPLGDPWLASATTEQLQGAILENMARNLSRKPAKTLAVDFLGRAVDVHAAAVTSHNAARYQQEIAAEPAKGPPGYSPPAPNNALIGAIKRRTIKATKPLEARMVRPLAQRPKERKVDRIVDVDAARAEFSDALRVAGVMVQGPPVMDGRWHRAKAEGDKGKSQSARYRGYLDGRPAGWISNYKQGLETSWKASGAMPAITAEQRRDMEARQNLRAAKDMADELAAGKKAYAIWQNAKPVKHHPYLERKGIHAHGLRQDKAGNLVVQMRDVAGYLHSVQTIGADGEKLFLKNGRMHGLFATLGEIDGRRPIVIGEGFATMASVREASGLDAVVAFNGGNLMSVAKALRDKYPDAPIIFAADNDHHLPRRDLPLPNVGVEKAEAAAAAVGGVVLLPTFAAGEKGTDWNDWSVVHGAAALRAVIEARLTQEGIAMPEKQKEPTQTQRDAGRRVVHQSQRDMQEQAQAAAREAAKQAAVQKEKGKGL
ncbi:MAG: hypothetical protein JWP29_1981 [Rhodoferax sp.]|nr:hypothetical protein [Rhodoferax sp.]